MNLYDIEVALETGETYTLDRYKGKVMLIVNTASRCGFATQFDELQTLYETYKDQDFVVLGFPSNQFKQEDKSADEAAEACRLTYGVSFPMHELVTLNGSDAHPLFQHLTEATKGILGKAIKWNFTKFLVDKKGNVVNRYAPKTTPMSFEDEIKGYL